MQIYTTDKTSPRGAPYLWYLRIPALVFSIVVLGITASDSSAFGSIGCNAPAKLSYNLAVAVISFVVLIYFLLSTGPKPQLRLLPWFIFGQLGLDALMFILWLAAGSSSSYSCNDLCNACNYDYDYVFYDTQACVCVDLFKRSTSPKPKGILEGRTPRPRLGGGSHSDSNGSGGSTIAAKQAFDAIMTVLFAIFVGSSIFFIVRSRQSNSTTAPTTTAAEVKHEEAGMAAGGAMPAQQPATNTQHYTSQPMPQQPTPQAQYVQSQPDHEYTQTQAMPQTETMPQTEHVPQQAGGPTFVPKDGAFMPKEGTFVKTEGVPEMPSAAKPPMDTQ